MRKVKAILTILTVLFLTLDSFGQVARETPDYESEAIKEIIEQMIETHGGWANWSGAPSIKYDNIFFNTGAGEGQNPWWVSTEIIEQKGNTRNDQRVHQFYHSGGKEGGFSMGYNGEEVWASSNWAIGNYPKFMNYFFYYFLNLPWLTQDDQVKLTNLEEDKYKEKDVYLVTMSFKEAPAIGKTEKDGFKLYIDKEEYILLAYEYWMGYGAQLDAMQIPKEREVMGPVFRHIDEYVTVDGLKFPSRMHTTNGAMTAVYGHHSLINYSINTLFDGDKANIPSGAVIDESVATRGN